MEKTIKFKKWCSERCGHPLGILMGLDAVVELQIENKRLAECNDEMYKALQSILDSPYTELQEEDFEMIEKTLAKARGEK